MKTFEIRILDDEGIVEQRSAAEFSDANTVRFINMIKARYPTVYGEPNEDGSPTYVEATTEQSFALWCRGMTEGTIANIMNYEKEKASQEIGEPGNITFTPVVD